MIKSVRQHGILIPAMIWLTILCGCIVSDAHLKKGREYAEAGDWDKSARFYREALEKYPGSTEVRLMLKGSRWRASLVHQKQGEALLGKGLYNEAITEFQLSLAMNPENRRVTGLIEEARVRRETAFHLKRARNLIKTGQYRQARNLLQKILEMDPSNPDAPELLAYFENRKARPDQFHLKLKNREPISLKFKSTPVVNVFEILSQLTGVNFIFDREVKDNDVTLFMTDVSFDRFLKVLLETSGLAAKPVDDKTLIIYPATPARIKEYEELQIRTFYLAHIKAKQAVAMLGKILKSQNIIANEELNAVVVRAPRNAVLLASRIIEANDRPVAEVLLNVEILEVSSTREQQLGLDFSTSSVTAGMGEATSSVDAESVFVGKTSWNALKELSSRELMLAVPTATLNFLKQDGDTRILASPQVRVSSGKASKILIGERVPLRTNRRVDTTGVVTFDFQYFEVGVKLDATPVINLNGEISLDLKLEISSLGPNLGTSDDPQYSIRTRTAQSILTLFDGEAVIIGGLISDEERETVRKLPFIGDIPILGSLFTNQDTDDSRTDILMTITPLITRPQDVPDMDIAEMWSGPEDHLSLSEPYENAVEKKAKYLDKPNRIIPLKILDAPETDSGKGVEKDDGTPPKE